MSRVVVKVFCSQAEQTSYKTVQLNVNETVEQVLANIRKKYSIEMPDYGLFLCDEKNKHGTWLEEGKTVGDYSWGPGTQIHFRSRQRLLKVHTLDFSSTKMLMIDDKMIVDELIPLIARRFGIHDYAEYSLQIVVERDNQNELMWLDHSKSLASQGLANAQNQSVVFRKKFFVTDFYVDMSDPMSLHLVYLEAKNAVITGFYPAKFDQAIYFSALEMQITYGNYDPLTHVAGFLQLQDFLPPSYAEVQFVEEDVYRAHRKLKDLSKVEAQYKYVKLCFSLPTYGVIYVKTKEASLGSNSIDHEFLLGVNADAILSIHPNTKQILARTSLLDLTSYEVKGRILTCQFTSGKSRKFILNTDEDSALLQELISGYIHFKKSKRKEIFAQKLFVRHVTPTASPSNRDRSVSPARIKLKPGSRSPYLAGSNVIYESGVVREHSLSFLESPVSPETTSKPLNHPVGTSFASVAGDLPNHPNLAFDVSSHLESKHNTELNSKFGTIRIRNLSNMSR